MAKKLEKDMTVGSPALLIISFAVPLILGNLLQQLYNFVDTMIVGHYLGVNALAGVGATGSINFLIVGFCMGVCSGFSIPVAQRYGAKDYVGLRKFCANAIQLSAVFSVVITVIVSLLCMQILQLMKTPENIIQYSYTYILTIFIGIPITFFYNLLAGFIRSIGDSRTPLICLIVSTIVNVFLDIAFITVFNMGILGAALATILSQLMSGLLCLYVIITKFNILHISGSEWAPDKSYMSKLCFMGFPMGLQYSITAIGSVMLQTSVNTLGSLAVASMTSAGKVNMLFMCMLDALGATMATYGGQNLGAGRIDRIKKGINAAGVIGIAYSLVALLVGYFVRRPFISLFLNEPNEELLNMASLNVLITLSAFVFLVFVNVLRFLIQGIGFPIMAIFAGVFEMIARAIAALFFVPRLGFLGACLASPLAWILADAFLFPAYFYAIRTLEKQIAPKADI